MKKLVLVVALAFTVSAWAPVFAQGTFTSEGPLVDQMKTVVEAYEKADWATYQAAFADTVMFYNNSADGITLEQRVEEHKAIHQVFDDIQFIDPVFGVVENEGETWALLWGMWSGTVRSTGEVINIPVHISSKREDGKTVIEYGYWDTSVVGPIIEAAMEAAGER